MSNDIEHRTLAGYLESHGLKHTKQRDLILDVFLAADGHVTSDELFQSIREENPAIGFTTVYRTMKLLCEAGLAQERQFGDGVTRYEVEHHHHDHLICTRCGKIVEFECAMIEDTQTNIAQQYGFRLLRHRHELYGHCQECQKET
jgi:Fur family ferric uptake transcriptional regulator